MCQCLLAKVEVDECRYHTDLTEAQGEAQILRAVLHEQCNSVTLLQAHCSEVVPHFVSILICTDSKIYKLCISAAMISRDKKSMQ